MSRALHFSPCISFPCISSQLTLDRQWPAHASVLISYMQQRCQLAHPANLHSNFLFESLISLVNSLSSSTLGAITHLCFCKLLTMSTSWIANNLLQQQIAKQHNGKRQRQQKECVGTAVLLVGRRECAVAVQNSTVSVASRGDWPSNSLGLQGEN